MGCLDIPYILFGRIWCEGAIILLTRNFHGMVQWGFLSVSNGEMIL